MKANQLSQTAAFVAIKFYGLLQIDEFRSLFDKRVISFYDRVVQSLPIPFCYYHFWLRFRSIRKLYIWSEELLLPGDLLHIVARKWYIRKITDQLLDNGYEQLVILGAGFDHLGYHYTQKGVSCFECDTPYMAEHKRTFLEEKYPNRLHPDIIGTLIPENQLSSLFSDHGGIDPQKKTVIIAEGFFDYLQAETVHETIWDLQKYFTHKPALISTHFALDELSFFRQKVFRTSVKLVGEQLQLKSSIRSFRELLSGAGYNISQLFDSQQIRDELQDQVNTPLPLLNGFYLCVAQ